MFKRRRTIQQKIPSSAQEFGALLLESGCPANFLQTVTQEEDIAYIFGSNGMVTSSQILQIFSLMVRSN